MLLELVTAAIIGISFGNAWSCIFMSFGTTSEKRSIGKWFIAGRFLGLVLLGSVISLLRFAASEATIWILLIFGISTITFGLYELVKHLTAKRSAQDNTASESKKYPSNHLVFTMLSLFVALPKKGNCKANGHVGKGERIGNGHNGKGQCKKHRIFEKRSGFYLGILRGATPCAKIIVLAPLLVAVGFPSSLLMILVYTLASTVYPVMGYLSADILSNFEKHQFLLKIAGAVILISIGAYTIFKVMTWSSIHA